MARLTQRELEEYREWIADLALEGEACDDELWALFSPDRSTGRQICASYCDEELLDHVLETMERQGHKVRREEIYCVYRRYLEARFGSWRQIETAARALKNRRDRQQVEESRVDGRASVERLLAGCDRPLSALDIAALEELCAQAKALGRAPARGEIRLAVFRRVNKLFGSWKQALRGMGIEPLPDGVDRYYTKQVKKGSHKTRK